MKKEFIIETVNNRWFLISKFFHNFSTWIIMPIRFYLYEKSFWDNIDYIIDFDNWKNLIPIYVWKYSWWNTIKFPKKRLTSSKMIEKYLFELKDKWKINFSFIKIIKWKEEIEKKFDLEKLKKSEEKINNTANFIEYFVIGRIYTIFQNIKTNIINSKVYKKIK